MDKKYYLYGIGIIVFMIIAYIIWQKKIANQTADSASSNPNKPGSTMSTSSNSVGYNTGKLDVSPDEKWKIRDGATKV